MQLYTLMMSYCVSITEQTTAKSYLFVLYNKKKTPELNRQIAYFLSTQTFGNLKKSKFYKYHAYMIYTNKGMLLATLNHVQCCDWLHRTKFCVT
jgi:hypothetical protein